MDFRTKANTTAKDRARVETQVIEWVERYLLIEPQFLDKKAEEKAANRFAGALLMPRDHLEREVGQHRNALGYRELIDLKRLYRVSGAALLVRLRDIGIISNSTLTYAFQYS